MTKKEATEAVIEAIAYLLQDDSIATYEIRRKLQAAAQYLDDSY